MESTSLTFYTLAGAVERINIQNQQTKQTFRCDSQLSIKQMSASRLAFRIIHWIAVRCSGRRGRLRIVAGLVVVEWRLSFLGHFAAFAIFRASVLEPNLFARDEIVVTA